ncbi:MAG: efflux RND transporter periplasmic adaptor subunit [Planctomycetaceae bacterium]|nr:efflux RND transporter periplasmic adaptor subunit [Planctomycetaceae bacterium]
MPGSWLGRQKPNKQTESAGDGSDLLVVSAEKLVQQTSFRKERTFTGLVKAKRESELSFEVAGKIVECLVDEGSRVEANAPLAKLEADRLEIQKKQTKAQLEQAQARLNELIAGPRVQTIKAKRDQVAELTAMRDLALGKKKRSDKLFQSGAITDQEQDEYYYDYLSVESRLSSAQEELNELEEGTREEQITAQQAVVDELNAALASIEIDLEDTELKAPFAGTIVSRQIDEGEVVTAGQPVFELVEDQALEVWVGVPVEQTSLLAEQTEFEVTINNKKFPVKRTSLIPRLNRETRTQSVLFHFAEDAQTDHIYPGQIARFHFAETIQESGFWVPTDALVRGTRGLWSCYTLAPVEPLQTTAKRATIYELKRRDVEELYTRDGNVFVTGTLQAGDLLLTHGAHRVVQGDRVRLKAESRKSKKEKDTIEQSEGE